MKTKLDMWMDFISQIDEKEVKNAMSKNKQIKKAQEEYEYLTGDEAERRIAFLREKAIRDENSIFDAGKDIGFKDGIEKGIKQGIAKGEKQGKKKEQREIVKSMIKEKIPVETIVKITKLSKEEIEKIIKEM